MAQMIDQQEFTRLLQGKEKMRQHMRDLPFSEKIKILIEMQKRARGFDRRRLVWGEIDIETRQSV